MSQITSTVSHDLSTWTTDTLITRADVLADLKTPETFAEAISESYDRMLSHRLCGCGGPDLCEVDDYRAIDMELAHR